MTQFVVVEGTAEQFEQAIGDMADVGWLVQPGWRMPDASGPAPDPAASGLALSGAVSERSGAEAAVGVAITGIGLVVHGLAERRILDTLCGDLGHLGALDHRVAFEVVALSPEDRRLLGLLLGGASVGTIAEELFLSRRSADRRIAALKSRFGVGSVGEALAAYAARLARLEGPHPA